MIISCVALPIERAEDALIAQKERGVLPVPSTGHVAWIGIEPSMSPLRTHPQPRQLLLNFHDVIEARDEGRWFMNGRFHHKTDTGGPTREHAQTIAAYVQELEDDPRPWALLVHCTGGISRSTAVVMWARQRYNVMQPSRSHYSSFAPNPTLSRYLREVSNDV